MTQAIQIPSMPAIIPVATFIKPSVVQTFQNIEDVPFPLQALQTVMMYIDNNGNVFHLNGPQAGREGVVFYENLQGEQHLFFEQVTAEPVYGVGGLIDRQNYQIRKINFRVFIGAPGMNNIVYRMSEDRWWAGQDEINGGWFGVFTRTSGWRWIQVWPEKTVETTQKRDPVAYDNNCAIWDVNWIAPMPNYSKPAVMSNAWTAANAGPADENGFYHGVIAVPNRADMDSTVRYLISGDNAGTAILQDNNSSNMVTIPEVFTTDGDVLVDSDPIRKTLIAQNDPMDEGFFDVQVNSGLVDFILSPGTTDADEALWLRGFVRFLNTCPPFSVTQLHVMHSNPGAVINAQLPQYYRRSR
jgi:hypothetical protein